MTQMTNIEIDSGNQMLIFKNMCQKIVTLVGPDNLLRTVKVAFSANPIQLQVAHK